MADSPDNPPAADDLRPGRAVMVAPRVRRLVAANPGPMTGPGTNSYILGEGRVAVIDPGPDDPAHVAALLAATAGETIARILLTHAHRDHSGAVRALRAATGAPLAAGATRRAAAAASGEATDTALVPELPLADGAVIAGDGWRLAAVATPGHAPDHFCFALDGGPLFSGDHVMGWSTTVVAPPEGSMAAYMASLETLAARPEKLYLPGHGAPLADGPARARALRAHRRMREAAILDRLARGDRTVAALVAAIYPGLDPRLRNAAALSVLAHLEDLAARGLAAADGPVTLEAMFWAR